MNAYQKIRAGMRRNERVVLSYLRDHDMNMSFILVPMAWYNAMDRLKARGRLRFNQKTQRYEIKVAGRWRTR